MAGTLLRIGNSPNINILEFAIDNEDEIRYLPTTKTRGTGKFEDDVNFNLIAPMGSTCICGNENGEVLIYMLFSFGWKKL